MFWWALVTIHGETVRIDSVVRAIRARLGAGRPDSPLVLWGSTRRCEALAAWSGPPMRRGPGWSSTRLATVPPVVDPGIVRFHEAWGEDQLELTRLARQAMATRLLFVAGKLRHIPARPRAGRRQSREPALPQPTMPQDLFQHWLASRFANLCKTLSADYSYGSGPSDARDTSGGLARGGPARLPVVKQDLTRY